MRINKYVAQATGISRRAADQAITDGRVLVNDLLAQTGQAVSPTDRVQLDGKLLKLPETTTTIILNKPEGYVCSRNGQGSPTVYSLLPSNYHRLKIVGRLDKDSSGLLLLTDDGDLADRLTHPKYQKVKRYVVTLSSSLKAADRDQLIKGIKLNDGLSRLKLQPMDKSYRKWDVSLSEGRNRQIRRSFEALGYQVTRLHRVAFGPYRLTVLSSGKHQTIA